MIDPARQDRRGIRAPGLLDGVTEVIGGDQPGGGARRSSAEEVEERTVAERTTDRVQGDRAALVHAVVEHVVGSGVDQQQIAGFAARRA